MLETIPLTAASTTHTTFVCKEQLWTQAACDSLEEDREERGRLQRPWGPGILDEKGRQSSRYKSNQEGKGREFFFVRETGDSSYAKGIHQQRGAFEAKET